MDSRTESEIRNIVRMEIKDCFVEIQSDVKQIKQALLGSEEYGSKGMISQLKENTNYIERSKILRISDRGEEALEWFEDWNKVDDGEKQTKMKTLGEMLVLYRNIKWLTAGIIALGLINIPSSIITLISLFSNLGK